MDSDRFAQAQARIEQAAARIAAAAQQTSAPAGDAELARKYETLRREAKAAMADLDRVIGSLET